ncbi:MAG: hypothetical protein AABX52_04110 [Nanoarchaeota archaeon]
MIYDRRELEFFKQQQHTETWNNRTREIWTIFLVIISFVFALLR